MNSYEIIPTVHTEVIEDMTPYETAKLMDELAALLQNQQARVNVSQESGFPYLWRVLTGKQRKLRQQITVDQTQINQIMQKLLSCLWRSQISVQEDINDVHERVNMLERIVILQNLNMTRMNAEIQQLGGQAVDMRPVNDSISDMMLTPPRERVSEWQFPEEYPHLESSTTESDWDTPDIAELISNGLKVVAGVGMIARAISAMIDGENDYSHSDWYDKFC